jgi:diacylglycerol kinase (ATP)
MSEGGIKPGSWLESVNCAIEGILWAAKTQRHLRWHLLAAVAVLLAAAFYKVSPLEFILLALAIVLVLLTELINTAIEVVVDMISPEFHLLAQRAKDVAAGAVLVTSIGAAVIGYLVFGPYLFGDFEAALQGVGSPPDELSVISALTVVILVVLIKARGNTGKPLHGGMPSGHSAIAFSIATSITISGIGPVLGALALAMAAMVSQSRLLLKIHTFKEVVAGAFLGTGVTLVFHLVFS